MVDKNEIENEMNDEFITDEELTALESDNSEGGDEVTQLQQKIKQLRTRLVASEEEKRKCLEDMHRTKADFLNSRRRIEEQVQRDKERATDKILMELLTLMDSFDTAMADKALWDTIDEKWRIGVEAIHGKLLSILKSNNVEQVDPHGKTFNPEEHEAVAESPVDDAHIDTIVSVLQKGYKRNETIIRPARVVVGTKK